MLVVFRRTPCRLGFCTRTAERQLRTKWGPQITPMLPMPMMPSVLPASCVPIGKPMPRCRNVFCCSPTYTALCKSAVRRARIPAEAKLQLQGVIACRCTTVHTRRAIISTDMRAPSATLAALTPGPVVTGMPRATAASTAMLLYPAKKTGLVAPLLRSTAAGSVRTTTMSCTARLRDMAHGLVGPSARRQQGHRCVDREMRRLCPGCVGKGPTGCITGHTCRGLGDEAAPLCGMDDRGIDQSGGRNKDGSVANLIAYQELPWSS